MTFRPIIPAQGYLGWQFLQRTIDTQRETFNNSARMQRETDYFREKIATIETAEQLVSDRRLLTVALGAFGLDEDINARAFIRRVLEDGTLKEDALAVRLADKRYASLSRTFGFGDLGGLTGVPGFADKIIERYEARQFEQAVGEQDNSMRLALNFEGELNDLLKDTQSGNARWFGIMGSTPLRTVFETALGLPSSFGRLDLDLQLTQFMSRAQSVFGTSSVEDFAEPDLREKLIRTYLVRDQVAASSALSGGTVTLSLLQSMPRPWGR